jgi:RNA polymerase sigma factor (sigma-70 family)
MAAAGDAGRVTGTVADATHDLYRQYGKQIYAYCLHQLRSREEAEDAVQTTFLNAFRGLQRGTTTHFEQAWLYKIAQNVCIARRSSSGRRLKLEAPDDFEILQDVVPSGSTPVDGDTLELMGLEEALDSMPENQRRAILLREWQGLSYREISTELGLSQGAVEMLIFRARRTLALALEQPDVAEKRRTSKTKTGFSFGSLIAAMKSLFSTGAALKMAAVAVSAAVVGTNAVHSVIHKTLAVRAARPAAAPVAPAHVVAVASVLTQHGIQRLSYRVKPHTAQAPVVQTSPSSSHHAPVVVEDVQAPPATESTPAEATTPAADASSQQAVSVVAHTPAPTTSSSSAPHGAAAIAGSGSPSDTTGTDASSSTTDTSGTSTTTSSGLGITGTSAVHDGRPTPPADDTTNGDTSGTGDTTTTTTTTTTDPGQDGSPPSAPAGTTDTSSPPPPPPPTTDDSSDGSSSGAPDSGSARGSHGNGNGNGNGNGHGNGHGNGNGNGDANGDGGGGHGHGHH